MLEWPGRLDVLIFTIWKYLLCSMDKSSMIATKHSNSIVICFLYVDSEKRIIYLAMSEWENHTCIRFKPRTTEMDYVTFIPGAG